MLVKTHTAKHNAAIVVLDIDQSKNRKFANVDLDELSAPIKRAIQAGHARPTRVLDFRFSADFIGTGTSRSDVKGPTTSLQITFKNMPVGFAQIYAGSRVLVMDRDSGAVLSIQITDIVMYPDPKGSGLVRLETQDNEFPHIRKE